MPGQVLTPGPPAATSTDPNKTYPTQPPPEPGTAASTAGGYPTQPQGYGATAGAPYPASGQPLPYPQVLLAIMTAENHQDAKLLLTPVLRAMQF